MNTAGQNDNFKTHSRRPSAGAGQAITASGRTRRLEEHDLVLGQKHGSDGQVVDHLNDGALKKGVAYNET